jgi:hypothetical protein
VSLGQTLILHREKGNPHDSNAVAVRTQSGTMLGHLSRFDAARLAPALDRGAQVAVQVEELVAKPARIRIIVDVKNDGKTGGSDTPMSVAPSLDAGTKNSQDGILTWILVVVIIIILWLLTKK